MDDLEASAVHVWQLSLAPGPGSLGPRREMLSPDEIERADRLYFEKDRRRYITARFGMRSILASYLGLPPKTILFSYSARGKPELAASSNDSGIQFNLSHSNEYALLAVSRGGPVGVDVEFMRSAVSVDEIASSFSPSERKSLQSLPLEEKLHGFYTCWTRKEAYTKAVGMGLGLDLSSFDVVFGRNTAPALMRVEASPEQPLPWRVYDLTVPPHYVAALVIAGDHHHIVQKKWEPASGQ